MKKLLLVLIVISFIGTAAAQVSYIPWILPIGKLEWTGPTTDTEGNPTVIDHYEVYESEYPTINWVYLGEIDTTEYLVDVTGIKIYGIIAVDENGFKSIMHLSTDPTANLGGWAVRRVYPPEKATMLRVTEAEE